jgi:dihydrofolate reductase
VQAEAHDWPDELFERRVWHIRRPVPEPGPLARAVELLRTARRPLIVCGGGTIYAEAMASADALDVTHVHRDVAGDTFFPPIDPARWKETWREDHDGFSFVTYRRA